MRLLFIAPPGAGKGTQSALITEKYGIPAVSSGNLLRAAIDKQTELGKIAEKYIHDGNYVPDEVIINLIEEELQNPVCSERGFILDGFPRTLYQALTLDKTLIARNMQLDAVLILYVPKTELINRLAQRRTCYNCGSTFHMTFNPPTVEGICDNCGSELHHRKDDRPGSIKNRIRLYNQETMPIIEYYSKMGIVHRVEGLGDINDVFAKIEKKLDKIK
jgi:adenylate kinase